MGIELDDILGFNFFSTAVRISENVAACISGWRAIRWRMLCSTMTHIK